MSLAIGDAGRVVDTAAVRALAPVDAIRSALLRALVGVFRPFAADRDARIALLAIVSIAFALALTGVAPLWLLAVAPIVLGVPHLAADLRYLVARPRLHRRGWAWLVVGLPLAATWIWPHAWVGLFASLGAITLAGGTLGRKALVLALWSVAFLAAWRFGHRADVVLAQAHNVVAFVLFAILFGRGRWRTVTLIAGAFVAASLAIFAGALDDLFVRAHGWEAPATGLDLDGLVATLSPVRDPALGVRWVLFFAFAQSVHYAIWVRLVPEAAREKPGMRPFASSYRALVRDLGRPLVVGLALVAAALVVYALVDLRASRDAYLRLAVFHGHLEIAALALFAAEGTPARAGRAC